MSEDIPELSDQDIVQLLAAQKTLLKNQPHPDETKSYVEKVDLKDEYQANIEEKAERYGVEI